MRPSVTRFKGRGLAAVAAVLLLVAVPSPAAAQAGTYASAGPMSKKRDLHTMTTLPDGTVLIAGGEDGFDFFGAWNDAEIYDPVGGTFTPIVSLMSSERAEHTATLLNNGTVLIVGGQYEDCCQYPSGNYGPRPVAAADVYDPVAHSFSAVGSLATARYEHAAVRLGDGRVLVAGGFTDISYGNPPTASAEIYDPVTHAFSATGSMTMGRAAPSMILLPSGKVLVVGGGGSTISHTAELFDPVTGTFTATAHPPVASETDAGLFLMSDGTVLVIGSGNAIERYDPATDTFTSVGTLLHSYSYRDNKILLTGGRILLAGHHASELYDPATNTSVDAGDPGVDLFSAGVPLSGDRALVTGGESFVPYTFLTTDLAKVFTPTTNAPPVANPGGDQTVSPGAGCTASVTLDGSASSDPDGNTLTYSWAEGATVLGTSATITVSLGPGTHVIALTVDDGHGGSDTRSVTITVTDTTAPSVTAPGPVTLEQAGPGGTTYTPALPVATDNCDPNPVVTIAGTPAGSLFPAGTTSLTYTATDAAGNSTLGSFTVTVHDTIAPAITIASPSGGAYALMQHVAASYACTDGGSGVASCTGPVASGSPIDTTTPGPHTFTVTATDAAGNASSASATYNVAGINGRMAGEGSVVQGGVRSRFEFLASTDGDADHDDGGRLRFWVETPGRHGDGDHDRDDRDRDDRGRNDHGRTAFESTSVTSIAFWHDPSIQSGRGRHQPEANSLMLSGVGRWNGLAGCTFTAQASDRGEPGRHRDGFAITIADPTGAVVATVNGFLSDGNIQSLPVHER